MQTKLITLKDLGYPEILVGADRGAYGVGRKHFVVAKVGDEIQFSYILGVGDTNDVWKSITMLWVRGIIVSKAGSIELKPLYEYYDERGIILPEYIEKITEKRHESTSDGLLPNGMYAYDYFYDLPGADRSGIGLYGIGVARFFAEQYGGHEILKVTQEEEGGLLRIKFIFVQFITMKPTYEILDEAPYPYQITVNPVDGDAPFLFSDNPDDGWMQENVFAFDTPTDVDIYIKDVNDRVAKFYIAATNWNLYITPPVPNI